MHDLFLFTLDPLALALSPGKGVEKMEEGRKHIPSSTAHHLPIFLPSSLVQSEDLLYSFY
jgi:hypothetical protein